MNSIKDVVVVGFALFAMFFGAGNLIFPPFLGVTTGESWLIGFLGFVLSDVGLAILAILAAAKCNGEINKILEKAGDKLSVVLGCAIMICLGPLLAIPRTAATTFEMGAQPIFGDISPVLVSVIFFVLTFVLTIKPSKVVDIIGRFLTPVLLIGLCFLIAKGIISPIGEINETSMIENVFSNGVGQGYQTMDAIGAVALSTVIISTITQKGYKDPLKKQQIALKSGLVAGIGLCIVYGGLTYLGATISMKYINVDINDISKTSLMVELTQILLGDVGKVLLSIIVSLACLTTSIGLTSAVAHYFNDLTNNKLKYEVLVTVICIFSAVVSNFGVNDIIKFSGPILDMIYPATIVLVILTLFSDFIKNDNVYKFATYTAIIISVMTVVNNLGIANLSFVTKLPFSSLGFNWVVPVVLAGFVGNFINISKN